MRLPFFSTSSSANGSSSHKKQKKGGSSSKRQRSLSRSDAPSFGSSSSSSAASDIPTTPKTVLPRPRPRPLFLGRNASCLDPEYSTSFKQPPIPSPFLDLPIRPGADGKVTMEELELVLRRLGGGFGDDEVAAVLAEADLDGDGRVSLEDVLLLRPRAASEEEAALGDEEDEEELRVAFGVYDVNGDGKISAEELYEVFRLIGDGSCSINDCRRMISGVDSDGDGFVCFRDFARMMSIKGQR